MKKNLSQSTNSPIHQPLTSILWLLFSVPCLMLQGCIQDPLLFRNGADYLPIAPENTWIYLQKEDNDTIILKVVDTTSIFARQAWILERNGIPEYYWKNNKRVDKLFCETILFNGVEDTVAKFWIPWIHTPLLINECWNYEFKLQKIILGDTVTVKMEIEGKVTELRNDQYLVQIEIIKQRKSKNFGTYYEQITYYEWYKPNVGLVKRTYNNSTEILISYSIH